MGSQIKLLIVDDQEELLLLFANQFERLGFHVYIARNAMEALEQAEGIEFDFILSDIQMADRDGLWLLHRIKDRLPKIPFYLMSAAAERYLDTGIAMGAEAVLNKPVDIHSLAAKMRVDFTGKKTQVLFQPHLSDC